MYAAHGDLVLLVPSASALRLMLRDCDSLAALCGLKFNSTKTQLIHFDVDIGLLAIAILSCFVVQFFLSLTLSCIWVTFYGMA